MVTPLPPTAIRHALSALARRPRLTAFAVVGLALGIGFQTAAFSVLYSALLRPLPIRDVDRLFVFFETSSDAEAKELNLSYPALRAWQEKSRCLKGISGNAVALTTLSGKEGPEVVTSLLVSANYFDLLGAPAQHGRTLTRSPGPQPEVVIANDLWEDRFGGDPGILGRSIQIGESFFTVVGVMPRDWGGSSRIQAWLPLSATPLLYPNLPGLLDNDDERILRAHARLADHCSREQAEKDLSEVAARIAEELPATHRGIGARLVPYRQRMASRAGRSLFLLQGGGVLVLLIVAANLANLLLAQGRERRREMAMRTALGAGPGQLLRQSLAEILLLALMGGVLGIGIAYLLLKFLATSGMTALPHRPDLALDLPVLGAALAVSLLAGLAAGLWPAIRASRTDPRQLLDGPLPPGPGNPRWRHRRPGASGLIVAETTLTVTLLVLAGLLLRSYRILQEVELGFSPERVLALSVSLPGERYPDRESLQRFYEGVRQEIAQIPGVEAVAAASDLPLQGTSCSVRIRGGEGLDLPDGRELACQPVTLGYLEALGIPILRGRDLEPSDYGPGASTALISRSTAELLWPGEDPIGRTLGLSDGERVRVVGVVGDVRHRPPDRKLQPILYLPAYWNNMSLLVRTAGEPSLLLEEARKSVWRVDPRQPVYRSLPLRDVVRQTTAGRRSSALLSALLGGFALIIGGFGLYGVMSHQLSLETRSLAIRSALGADRERLLRWLIGRGLISTAVGSSAGLLLASVLSRFAESLLYGVSRLDPSTYVTVILITLAAAALACYGPSRRALARDPASVLRTH